MWKLPWRSVIIESIKGGFTMNSLGERIAFFRKKKELTQEQLAEKCSVSAQAVSKWENDITAPDINLLPALSNIFGVSCDELLGVTRQDVTVIAPELVNLNKALLKIRVADGKDKVNINVPLAVAEVFLKSGMIKAGDGSATDKLKNIDFEQIISLVKAGTIGKLVEIDTEDDGKVEIWVE